MAADITSLVIETKSQGISEASKNLKELSTQAGNAEKRVASLEAAMEKINAANRTATSAADSYMTKLREQAALMQGMAANSRTAAGSTEALAAAMALLSTSLNLLNQNTQNAERTQRRHNESMQEAHALARGLSGSLGALWMTYGNLAGMAVGVAIGASLKGIVTVGKDVEHTLEGIRVRGNETVESVDKIRGSVMELGKGVYGPQEVAHAFETLVLAGLNAEQAVSSITAALNLATVGGVSIEKAATTLVSVGTAIGFTAEGFGRVGDVIAKTAALSMSSVETLSEAFKSASSVNRLYGVSLEDIGTSLGVLSNLGIQGSAAGTALKNMYKELASEADKVKTTLNDIGLSSKSFKDAEGNFKPLIEVISTLDAGIKKLDQNEQKLAIARLSNERGLRLITQALGEYNTKTADGSNALQRFRDNVENSYGFAAKGAVQMSLTAKSQIDSMFNTLKTSFAETFTSVQPEIMAFSARMKEAFSSKEFKDGLVTLAQAFAKLAVAIVDNLPLLAKFTVGLLAVKAAMMGAAVYEAAAAGIKAISLAIAALEAGTLSLAVAFPPLLIILATATAAWVAYNLAKGGDPQKQARDAEAYASGYISGLVKEAENLDKVNQKMRERKTIAQANAEIERDESRQKMVMQDNKAITEAETNLQKVMSSFSFNRTKQIAEQTTAQQALDNARMKATNNVKLAEAAEASLFAKAKENADLAKAQADAARKQDQKDPTAHLSGKIDTAGINDAYHAAIKLQEGYIADSNKAMAGYEKQQNAMLKAGEQSKLETLQNIGAAQLATSIKNLDALNKEYELAASRKDGKSDMQGIQNKMLLETQTILDSQKQMVLDSDVYLRGVRQASAKLEIKEMEEKGEWVKAAQLRFEGETKSVYLEVEKAVAKYGDQFPELIEYLNRLKAAQSAAMDSAKIKEVYKEFEVLRGGLDNLFKGLVADNQGLGIAGIFTAALDASEKFQASLPAAQAKLAELKALMDKPNATPQAALDYNKAFSELQTSANHQKTMWAEVGESISKSLGDAFGNAGKSAGKLLLAATAYGNTQEKINKSSQTDSEKALSLGQARIHSYGDMAGAAKGFFHEGTTGYKLMSDAEKAFRIMELAEAARVFVAKSSYLTGLLGIKVATDAAALASDEAYTIASLAKSALRATADGIAAVARAIASMPFPLNIAAGAATAAALAGFGVMLSSGGGGSGAASAQEAQKKRIETQGTGTVLGDSSAKSNSIENSLTLIAAYSFQDLEYSNKMLTALNSISSSLSGVSKSLALTSGLMSGSAFGTLEGSSGGFGSGVPIVGKLLSGIFGGKTSSTITGSGIDVSGSVGQLSGGNGIMQQYEEVAMSKSGGLFGRDKNWIERPVKELEESVKSSFALTFASVSKGLSALGVGLGMDGKTLADTIAAIPINMSVELRGLKGKELTDAVSSVLSATVDEMTRVALAVVIPFNKMGEGLLETAYRVADTSRVIDLQLKSLGMTFGAVGVDSLKARMALVDMAGGLEEFTSKSNFFKDNFLTEAQKMEPVTKAVSDEMARLNLSSVKTVEQFSNVVLAQDTSTTAGAEMYTALMNVAPAFKLAADYSDDLAAGTVTLTKAQQRVKDIADKDTELSIALLRAQGKEQAALNMERDIELATLTKLSPALADKQREIYKAIDDASLADKQKSVEIGLLRAQGREQEAVTRERIYEIMALEKLSPQLAKDQLQTYKLIDAKVIADKQSSIEIALLKVQGKDQAALTKERQTEIDALNKLSPVLGILQAQFNSLTDAARIKTVGTSIFNSLATDVQKLEAAKVSIADTFKKLGMAVPEDVDSFISLSQKYVDKVTANTATDIALANIKPKFDNAISSKSTMPQEVWDVFKGLGMVVPKTIADFTALQTKMSTLTAGNIATVDALDKVSGAFKTVKDAADKEAKDAADAEKKLSDDAIAEAKRVADALKSINDGYQKSIDELIKASLPLSEVRAYEIKEMDATTIVLYDQLAALKNAAEVKNKELELYNLSHTASEQLAKKRELELSTMTESVQVIQKQINAQEDLNAITEQRKGMELSFYNLTHTASEQLAHKRQLELDVMDKTLQPLQQMIYSMEDLASASELLNTNLELMSKVAELTGDTAMASVIKNQQRAIELNKLDPSLKLLQEYVWSLEDAAPAIAERKSLEEKLLTLQDDTVELRKRELDKILPSNQALQERIWLLEDEKKISDERKGIESTLADLLGNTTMAREKELSTLDASNRSLMQHVYALKDADTAVTNAMSTVQRAIDAEKKNIQDASDSKVAAIQASIDAKKLAIDSAKTSVDSLKGVFDDIASAVKTLRGNVDEQVSLLQARSFIDMSVTLARAGAIPDATKLKDAIGAVTKDQKDMYVTGSDFVYAQMVQAGKLEELGGLVGDSKTVAEQQLDKLNSANTLAEDQIKAIEKATASQLKALDNQLQAAQDAISVMRGVDISVQSVTSAVMGLQGAINALASARSSASTSSGVSGGLPTTPTSVATSGGSGYTGSYYSNPNFSHLDSSGAITNELAGLAQDKAGLSQSWIDNKVANIISDASQLGLSSSDIKAMAGSMGIPGFDSGINVVPEDMLAQIHEGEAVVPKKYNPFIPGTSSKSSEGTQSNAEMLAELKALREEMSSIRESINSGNSSTRQLARQFDSATNGGNTMLVSIAEDLTV